MLAQLKPTHATPAGGTVRGRSATLRSALDAPAARSGGRRRAWRWCCASCSWDVDVDAVVAHRRGGGGVGSSTATGAHFAQLREAMYDGVPRRGLSADQKAAFCSSSSARRTGRRSRRLKHVSGGKKERGSPAR